MASNRKIITSDDILGKDAVDPDGQVLGVVIKLHIDKEMKKMTGITIDEGFMKPNLFVGINYIKNFGIDSVFLSRIPTEKYVGLKVLDSKGKVIGTVKSVKAKRHKVKSLEISKGLSGRIIVSYSDVQEIEDSVILKENYKAEEVK
ncbi:PRC-barrel domain-containing protein [Candidatus Woesearchaeota archaeon]|nr:PRC-barrel domain-containing protein [Candidatus Woesearchaeota archaeon]